MSKTENNNHFSQTNKLSISVVSLLYLCIIIGNIVEAFKENPSVPIPLLIFFSIVIIFSLIVDIILYKKNSSNQNLKYFIFYGYFIVYLVALFGSSLQLTFVYIISILILSYLYFDIKLIKTLCISSIAINVLKVVLFVIQGKTDSLSTTNFTIQICTIIIVSIALYGSSKLSIKLNEDKINSIKANEDMIKNMLNDVLKTASLFDKNSNEVYNIVTELEESSNTINSAISNISKGMETTVNSVQNQTELTEKIQQVINSTSEKANHMGDISSDTIESMNNGIYIVEDLNNKTKIVNENSDNVEKYMIELKDNTSSIQKITQVITELAEQTNLLSLNASIESARAGEAGKGFAVVADEIRNLATQSGESANDITEIVSKLQEMVDICVNAVSKLREVNKEQNSLISDTSKIFKSTINKMNAVNENAQTISSEIINILSTNDEIISNIQDISSISEETMAAVEETTAVTEQNLSRTSKTKELTQELLENSKEMNKYI
ncbi:MAG: hypothetical protein GX275_13245 [Clostridiales bacterium]|nr:hypothetical protein [Clostridiales bacterium]